jgi:hypothetical protein
MLDRIIKSFLNYTSRIVSLEGVEMPKNFESAAELCVSKAGMVSVLWKFIGVAMGATMGFFLPMWSFLGYILALVIADMYTGYRGNKAEAIRDNTGKNTRFNSEGVGNTWDKLIGYFIGIALCRGMELLFIPEMQFNDSEFMPLVYSAAGIVSVRELKSVFENIEKMTGTDLWSSMGSSIENIINKFNNK